MRWTQEPDVGEKGETELQVQISRLQKVRFDTTHASRDCDVAVFGEIATVTAARIERNDGGALHFRGWRRLFSRKKSARGAEVAFLPRF